MRRLRVLLAAVAAMMLMAVPAYGGGYDHDKPDNPPREECQVADDYALTGGSHDTDDKKKDHDDKDKHAKCKTFVDVDSACEIVDGKGVGLITFTVGEGALLSIEGVGNFGPGDGKVNVEPGTYNWSATAEKGYKLKGDKTGTEVIEDCTPPEETTTTTAPPPEETSTTVAPSPEETATTVAPEASTTPAPATTTTLQKMQTDLTGPTITQIATLTGLIGLLALVGWLAIRERRHLDS
jgi:hypothetical protein